MPQYDMDSGVTNLITKGDTSFSIGEVWMIISVLLAVIGGMYLFSNYFNKEKAESYTGFKKKLFDFLHFEVTIIEPIFKVLYLIIAISITLSSFSFIAENFFKFIGVLLFGNLIARLAFELLLLTLKMFKDVSEINVKLSKEKNVKKTKEEQTKTD